MSNSPKSNEAPGGENDFQQVTVQKALEKLVETIRLTVETLDGQTSDGLQFKFKIRNVDADVILTSVDGALPRPLKAGESIELLIGCSDGLYLVRTVVRVGKQTEFSFQMGKEVYRMQRRNNFRAAIPSGLKVFYKIQTYKNAIVPPNTQAVVVDLSSGGMRLKWPNAGVERAKEGEHLGGTLTLPNGKTIEVFGVIRTLLPQSDASLLVGVEFQNASLRDEQALLFAVVQLQREYAARI